MTNFKDFLLAQAKFSFVKRKSVLRCEGCLMKEQQKERDFTIGGCNAQINICFDHIVYVLCALTTSHQSFKL